MSDSSKGKKKTGEAEEQVVLSPEIEEILAEIKKRAFANARKSRAKEEWKNTVEGYKTFLFWVSLIAVIAVAKLSYPSWSYNRSVARSLTNGTYIPETVLLPSGTFMMGCVSDKSCDDDEKPVHSVTISKFYMSIYETTFAQWDACVKDGGCTHKPKDSRGLKDIRWGREKRPVTNVSWNDANEYAKWLSGKTGLAWRLPTEAEWEYAARAGTRTKYSFGDTITTDQANFNYKLKRTAKVGSYPANKFGLYDMHGNVSEIVFDRYGKYKKEDQTNPKVNKSGSERVWRGGYFFAGAAELRSADRAPISPDSRNLMMGFRLMRQSL